MRRRRKCPPISQRPRSRCLKRNASRVGQARPTSCVCLPSGTLRVTVHVVVGEGPPQDAILGMAAAFDLIVVGTHRRHGARRWWLGSVAEAVVRRSPRPVLVVPAAALVPDTRRPSTILAAGDDTVAVTRGSMCSGATFGGQVVRRRISHQCPPDRVENTDLIVLSMPADVGTHGRFGAIVQVLKECVHPVLFVPSADGIFERSSS